ncbi:MAG: hypothetical protein HRT45_14235 [Bdellovibrionales bacterium]|nr:hypothetical protein [Bdellovibrionales bacterium]
MLYSQAMKKSNRSVAKIESITVRVTKIVALFTFICPLFVFAFVKQGEIDTEMGEGTGEVIQIEDQLLEIDVSGRHGRSSPRGTDYDNIGRASRNQQGRAGGNSPEPQEGTSGGQLELNFDVSEGVISIYGYAITSRGQANNALNCVLDVGTIIRAVFRGGTGG